MGYPLGAFPGGNDLEGLGDLPTKERVGKSKKKTGGDEDGTPVNKKKLDKRPRPGSDDRGQATDVVDAKPTAAATEVKQTGVVEKSPGRAPTAPGKPVQVQRRSEMQTMKNPLVHPMDTEAMARVMGLAVLPPPKVDGKDNPMFWPARAALKKALEEVSDRDIGRKLTLFIQRTISGTAIPEETNAMFGLLTALGRRWQAHDVLAVKKVVAAAQMSVPTLKALFTTTFVAPTREGPQNRVLAREIENTNYVSYAYSKEALPVYLKILRDNGLTSAAAELERHIGESNMRAVRAAMQRDRAAVTVPAGAEKNVSGANTDA